MSVKSQARAELVKLSIFATIAVMAAGYLVVVMGDMHGVSTATYRAEFANVSGLRSGDRVRVASVAVGEVESIDIRRDATVQVTFNVDDSIQLNNSTTAKIRYKNLIGDRFLELDRADESAAPVAPGATIPASRTSAALDLDTLLNGFKPLFVGLNPQQINELSGQLVQVLQGQSSAVRTLLSTVASVTSTLGNREELVTQVLSNLNTVLGTVDDRKRELSSVITGLSDLVVGLEKQDTEVLDAAERIDRFARETSSLVSKARGDLTPDLKALALASGKLNSSSDTLQTVLNQLPKHYKAIGQTSAYGNFFNFFLCGIRVQIGDVGGQRLLTPWIKSDVARCQR